MSRTSSYLFLNMFNSRRTFGDRVSDLLLIIIINDRKFCKISHFNQLRCMFVHEEYINWVCMNICNDNEILLFNLIS